MGRKRNVSEKSGSWASEEKRGKEAEEMFHRDTLGRSETNLRVEDKWETKWEEVQKA